MKAGTMQAITINIKKTCKEQKKQKIFKAFYKSMISGTKDNIINIYLNNENIT